MGYAWIAFDNRGWGMANRRTGAGFTLIEIVIVLVIVGALLGGVLKGQELIAASRVRNLIAQQDAILAAYFGFRDRFRALPGDYAAATTSIAGISTSVICGGGNGDGNGRIETGRNENTLAWEHLAKAGLMNGSFVCAESVSGGTSPANAYGVYLQLTWDAVFDPPGTPQHNLKTGGQIPSDLLAEFDRKIDDGNARGGGFRFSAYDGGAGAPVGAGTCYQDAAPHMWNVAAPAANCGGATLLP
jgi:prepilin-type N-terminal cleavage/methylation domain-containing protein